MLHLTEVPILIIELHDKENVSFELPDFNMSFNAADREESIPTTSASANAPPFAICSYLRPVGR